MSYTIHQTEYKQLVSLLGDRACLSFLFNKVVDYPHDRKQLHMSPQENTLVVDALGDIILTKGITGGEINSLGISVETLIDKLSEHLFN